jgi:DNA-directed RNA polymerase subunit RPC12/RpoP
MKYKCAKCGKDFVQEEIRYTSSNKMACVYCLGIQLRPVTGERRVEKIKDNNPVEETVEYQCTKCNYAFKRKKSFLIHTCPYCSNNGSLTIRASKDAKNILRDSMDNRYDF